MNTSDFSVCILTAGLGSRMGPYSSIINKALLPYKNKALISHIIEQFGEDKTFVIAVGCNSEQVIDYIRIAHPSINVTFVDVPNYDSPSAGPAQSLYKCREHLSNRFYFVSCDTLFNDFVIDKNQDKNWIGIATRPSEQSYKYCNIKAVDEKVLEIVDKQYCDDSFQSFIGLMHIKDPDMFFDNMSKTIEYKTEISQGFQDNLNLYAYPLSWQDFGTYDLYKAEISKVEDFDFCKTDEFFYDVNGKIIKFHSDPNVSYDKYIRVLFNKKVFPHDFSHRGNFHYYNRIEGNTLYENITPEMFGTFLNWLQASVWFPVVESDFKKKCYDFYYKKTIGRIEKFYEKYTSFSDFETVNNYKVLPLQTCIKMIDWDSVCDGISSFTHGDLQFDNILCNNHEFVLLDWRQKFSNSYFGDIYYDLAKMYGGMILNYNLIKKGYLHSSQFDKSLEINISHLSQDDAIFEIFENFVESNNYDMDKISLLVPIIYINMSPLHSAPFDKILYGLSQYYFTQWFEKKRLR